ncbi:PHP domain-containing protein [candidate division KSB1 bacterium]|nr:PHP domain-containing protein [candidate division KSB1 bacterium]
MIDKKNASIDLHIHSHFSDGLFSPKEIVTIAQERGLVAIAIADHDNFFGLIEAVQAGKDREVQVIPAVELSCTWKRQEVHLLGYLFNPQHPMLLNHCEQVCRQREQRALKIVRLLQKQGIRIGIELVRQASGQGCIGRPHIAQVLVDEGFVFSIQEAFEKYLGDNRSAYVEESHIDLAAAIRLLQEADGLTVLSHPGLYDWNELIPYAVGKGLDGLEIVHPRHDQQQQAIFRGIASSQGLLMSGGSDYHGQKFREPTIGLLEVPRSWLQQMMEKAMIKQPQLDIEKGEKPF